MSKSFYRFCIFNGVGAVLFAWAFMLGYVQTVFTSDSSGLSYLIAALFLVTLARLSADIWRGKDTAYVSDVRNWLETLGLIGTVIGFPIALSGVDINALLNAGSAQGSVSQFLTGIAVACYTTLVGAVCSLWLDQLRAACK